MARLDQSIEKTAGLCVGVTAFALGKPDGAGQASVSIAGLIGLFVGSAMNCGPERKRAVASIRKTLLENYSDEITKKGTGFVARLDLKAADKALLDCLPGCFLDHQSLAEAANTPEGFPQQAVALIMARLAQSEPTLFGPEMQNTLAYRYAKDVILAGIQATLENEDYYRKFERRLIIEMASTGAKTHANTQEIIQRLAQLEASQSGGADVVQLQNQLSSLLSYILEQPIEPEQVEQQLQNAFASLKAFRKELSSLQRLSNEIPEIQPDLDAAQAALDAAGQIDLAEAERRITQACALYDEKEAQRARHRQAEALRDAQNRAALYRAKADLLQAQGRYEEAADVLLATADKAAATSGSLARELTENAADVLKILGETFGQPGALERSVQLLAGLITQCSRDNDPMEWARLQNNLGNALSILGERGNDTALGRAVDAYEWALAEWTQEKVPLGWATIQNNLGIALSTLGKRGDDAALGRAVEAYELALEEWTQEKMPLEWAMTQNNLGNALLTLGKRGDDVALGRAVEAYERALEERTQEKVPLDWAMTQNNLGIALSPLSKRGDDAALGRAVEAFQLALEERTQEKVPLYWATTQNNLGNALLTRGERGDDVALGRAVEAYERALEERTQEKVPLQWAMTQANLGNAKYALNTIAEAKTHWKNSLTVFRDLGWTAYENQVLASLRAKGIDPDAL